MKSHFSLVPASLVLLAIFVPVYDAPAGKYQQVQLEGLTITMTLEKRAPNVQRTDWPDEPISLTSQSVPVNGKTIHELLKEVHIFPDVEAFTVVYALNPDIQELRELKVSQIRIPKLVGGPKLEAAFKSGFVVLLTAEKEKKQQFSDSVQRVKTLVQDVSKFGPERFQVASTRDSTINSLNSTATILAGINQRIMQRFGRPITGEALSQLNADAELLNEMLSAKVATGAQVNKADQDRISALEKDVKLKGRAFSEVAAGDAPDRYPEVKVIVKTLRAGSPILNLRIYYVPEASRGKESKVKSFGILSSPSNQELPEADYCFWAAIDPTTTPVTNEQCLEIRKNRQSEVQLTVIR